MKTPREIILDRHKDVEPSLDQIRHSLVAQIGESRTPIIVKLWNELIVPVRHAWIGIGAGWVIVLLLSIMARGEASVHASKPGPVNPDSIIALQRKEQLMAKLARNDDETSMPADIPERRPRSELTVTYKVI